MVSRPGLLPRRTGALSALLRSLSGIGMAIAVFVGLWALLVHQFQIPAYMLPEPAGVWQALLSHRAKLGRNFWFTAQSALAGLAISTTFAIALALAFINSPAVARATFPLVIALRTVPVIAVAPLITLMVGRGFATSVVVVTIVSFFPLLVNLMRGLGAVDPGMVELMRVCGAGRWQQIWVVRVPCALPYFFAGLRVAGSAAILGALLAEWLTGMKGLGYLIIESAELRETELMWVALFIGMTMALVVFAITSAAERATLHWKR